jgi:hypothetical protein
VGRDIARFTVIPYLQSATFLPWLALQAVARELAYHLCSV